LPKGCIARPLLLLLLSGGDANLPARLQATSQQSPAEAIVTKVGACPTPPLLLLRSLRASTLPSSCC
jgi:hypothetical protein